MSSGFDEAMDKVREAVAAVDAKHAETIEALRGELDERMSAIAEHVKINRRAHAAGRLVTRERDAARREADIAQDTIGKMREQAEALRVEVEETRERCAAQSCLAAKGHEDAARDCRIAGLTAKAMWSDGKAQVLRDFAATLRSSS